MFGFLILMTKDCRNTLGEVLGNKLCRETRESSKMCVADCAKKRRRNWASESGMEISCEFLFGLVSSKNAVGLMCSSIQNW